MKKCIVIPTHPPHFDYVKKLLNSIDKYNSDDEIADIFVIVSKEYKERIFIEEYKTIDILILFIEDIIFKIFQNLDQTEENIYSTKNLYKECNNNYSYQSIKKILSVRYVTSYLYYDNVYVLDSEGLFIRPFSLNSIFSNYLSNKKIYFNSKPCSRLLKKRGRQCLLAKDILNTKISVPGWLLENYLWIYEKNIVDDFFKLVFKNMYKVHDIHNIIKKGTFIELVYYHFIFINNSKYNYKFINTYEEIKKYVKKSEFKKITTDKWYSLLEDIRFGMNYCPSTTENMSKFFRDNNIINLKIKDDFEINLEFLKITESIILINSGDFNLDFNICLENE